jgi:hypothetical protein
MAIATTTQFWTNRMTGENPTDLAGDGQTNWGTAVSGTASAVNNNWVITANTYYSLTPTTNAYTMIALITFSDSGAIPSNGAVLMSLDNGTKKVEVRSKGNTSKLDLVGATTATTRDLDLDASEGDDSVPVLLRLTLDASGNAKLYMREIIEDDDGATNYISVAGASGSSKEAKWGNSSGTVTWHSLYYTDEGAFDPDEMSMSDWTTNTFLQMGLATVQLLKDSTKPLLKTHVHDSSIVYGYDMSSDMVARCAPPAIYVILDGLNVPEFVTLGATRAEHEYVIKIFVVTRGTGYRDSYRMGLDLCGEIFDEIFKNTGLNGTTDSLISYDLELDQRMDADEIICVHELSFTYMRRINMLHR